MILIGILLFGAGCMATVTAPFYHYGEPRGAGASWAGITVIVVGIGMIAAGAIVKALGMGATKEEHGQQG